MKLTVTRRIGELWMLFSNYSADATSNDYAEKP